MSRKTEQDKLTKRIRATRATVRANKTADRKANVPQLAARINDLESLVLAQARQLAIITDDNPADLTDDD